MPNADRLIEIYNEAKALPAGAARDCFLLDSCGEDADLRQEVIRLLQSSEDAGDFLKNALFQQTIVTTEKPGDKIGRYTLVQKIGEGGCGVVYVAEQTIPIQRRVALKVLKIGMDTKSVISRFEGERQALAMMDHPNIAMVLDAGATETGRPYFVMELVEGKVITTYCDEQQLSTRERLDLFIKVCAAIQHAHQKGIIHRDIKPSNILVAMHDGAAAPKVIDFGIAKAIESRLSNATVYTQLLHFIGTPAYMSPEQAEFSAVDIDTRSDIYSLGVLLYELLTGKTPFDAQTLVGSGLEQMRKTIREIDPLRPSTRLSQEFDEVNPGRGLKIPSDSEVSAESRAKIRLKEQINRVRGDLDWIVMKCLEKNRTRRYETANGLAADLNRHLHDQPVEARPPTAMYRFRKAVRRNRLVFTFAGAVLAALFIGLLLALAQTMRARRAEHDLRRNSYAAEVNVAFHALAENNLGRARELLNRQRPNAGEEDLRDFEWRYLWQLCRGDEFATFTGIGARAVAFSPDGKLFAYSDSNKLMVRDVASQKVITNLPTPAVSLGFAPRANLLVAGSPSGVTVWNSDTWQMERSLPDTSEPSLFSPNGKLLLTGGSGVYRLWDTETWEPQAAFPDAPLRTYQARNLVAFSPDGEFAVTPAGGMTGNHLRVWRFPSYERVLRDIQFEDDHPGSVAFSRDGRHLVVGLWSGRVAILEFPTLQEKTLQTKAHSAWVTAIAFDANGLTFATSSSDRTLNLWDGTTFEHLRRLRGHVGAVTCVSMSPDGSTLASGSDEGRSRTLKPSTKLWNLEKRPTNAVLEGTSYIAGSLQQGRQIVAVTTNGWSLWMPENGRREDFSIAGVPAGITRGKPYDVKPDEPFGAFGRSDGSIEIWHLLSGTNAGAWPAHRDAVSAVTFSPDGKRLASGTIKGEVKVWDIATRREVRRLAGMDFHLYCLAFAPDGETLAASGTSGNVHLWSTRTGAEILRLRGHGENVPSVAFSPNGKLLATTTFVANEARLWELPSGKELAPLKGHVSGVTAVTFSPDGNTLATAGFDRKVKLWNLSTHHELVTFSMGGRFPTLRFSPDGRTLIVGNLDQDYRRVHVLSAPSFKDIAAAETKLSPSANLGDN